MNLVSKKSVERIRAPDFATDDGLGHPAPRWLLAIIATSLSAGILMAALVPGWIGADRDEAIARASNPAVVKRAGDALPLYELPPITVVADRKTELAKIALDDQLMHARQARSKTAVKPPV